MNGRRLGLAALAGLLVTLALLAAPLLGSLPPLVPPYVPIDLRFVILPALFAGLQAFSELFSWPGPATTVLGSTVLAAIAANVHASQALAYLGVGFAQGGAEVDLAALAAALAGVLVGLGIAFDAAHERFRAQLVARGLDEAEIEPVTERVAGRAQEAIAIAGLAAAALALVVRLASTALGGASVPFPQLIAIGVVLAAGALLLGLPRRATA